MRTKGATSAVAVKLSQLNELLKPDAVVYIWRRQADQLGLIGVATPANEDTLKASGNQAAVEEIVHVEEIK